MSKLTQSHLWLVSSKLFLTLKSKHTMKKKSAVRRKKSKRSRWKQSLRNWFKKRKKQSCRLKQLKQRKN